MSAPATASGNRPLGHLKLAELKQELNKKELDQKGVNKSLVEKLEDTMLEEGHLVYFENQIGPEMNIRSGRRELQEDSSRPVESEGEGHDPQKGGGTEYTVYNGRLEQAGSFEMYVRKNDAIDTNNQISKRQAYHCGGNDRELYELDNGASGNDDRVVLESSGLQCGLDEWPPGTDNIYKPIVAKDCLIQASHATADNSERGVPGMIENSSISRGFLVGTSMTTLESNAASQQTNDAEMVGFVDSRDLDPKVEEMEGIAESRAMHLNVEQMVGIVECDMEDVKVKEMVDMQEWRRENPEVKKFLSQEHGPVLSFSSKYPFETQILLHEPVRSEGVDERITSPVNVFTSKKIKLEERYIVDTFEKDFPHSSKDPEGQGLLSQVSAGLLTSSSYMSAPQLLHGPVKSQDDEEERASPVVLAATIGTKLGEGYAFGMGEKDMPQSMENFCERDSVCKEGNTKFDGWGEEGSKYGFVDEYSGLGYLKSHQGGGYGPKDLGIKVEPRNMEMGYDRRKGLYVKAEHQLLEFCGGGREKLLHVKAEPQVMELIEDMRGDVYRPMEIDSQVLMSQRRNEEEGKARHQESAKRQRRWNSGNDLTVEAARSLTMGTTVREIVLSDSNVAAASVDPPLKTTSKIMATTRPPSTTKIGQFADGGRERQRIVPPASRPPTNSLRIDRFLRPFTLKAVKELLSQTGFFSEFWMDQIKTHCYVMYPSVEEAIATRNSLYDLQWPPSFGNTLVVDFVDPEEVRVRSEGHLEKSAVTPKTPHAVVRTSPPAQSVMPSAPVTLARPSSPLPQSPPMRERPVLVPIKEPEPPILTLDDIFKKTKAKPHIYYLTLTEEEIVAKLAAKKERQSSDHLIRA